MADVNPTTQPQKRRAQRRPLPQDSALRLREVVREQVEVRGYLSGGRKVRMKARQLYRALGPVSWRVYSALLTFRDSEGDTRVTTASLAVASQCSEAGVKRALVRLRHFKLIEDLGWMFLVVPCACPKSIGTHEHEVYVRRVFGQLQYDDETATSISAWLPPAAVERLMQSQGLGGRRSGAGRKGSKPSNPEMEPKKKTPASKPLRKSDRTTYKNLSCFYSEVLSEPHKKTPRCGYVSLFVKEKAEKSQRGHESLPEYSSRKCRNRNCHIHHQPKAQLGAPSSGFLRSSSGGAAPAATAHTSSERNWARSACDAQAAGKAAAVPASARLEERMGVDSVEVEIGALGGLLPPDEGVREWTLSGDGRPKPRQRLSVEDLQALTELVREIKVARVPAPPKITEELDEDQRIRLMQAAYRAAHEKVMGSEFYSRRKAQSAKEREAMLAAAEALLAHDISPTSWARFSFHTWRDKMKNPRPPAAQWVWSAQRIEKHRGWCRDATGTQNSNLPLSGPAHRALVAAYGRLTQELGRGKSTAAVVESVLPTQKREELLAALEFQNARAIKDVKERIRAGEWVW